MKDKVQKIREEVEMVVSRRLNLLNGDYFDLNKEVDGFTNEIMDIVDSLQEEPVSKDLNTESMIESYKQRLISQANGMKNSPLIDMCLVSYKHGINETLDTLKLSNAERTVKNWKEPVSEELEKAAIDICSKVLKGETITIDGYEYVVLSDAEECFKAGAKWQKEKEYTCYEEAFEDGAKWKKEQIEKVLLSEVLPCFMHGGEADEVVAKLDEVLNQKK